MAQQMKPLADAGFRAVAIDLPGYGRSDKPGVRYDVMWLCACLAGVIEALGAERAVVVGHDWGGLLAWPLARLHPEKVAGVIGINTPDTPLPPVPPTELLRRQGSRKHSYILEFQNATMTPPLEYYRNLDRNWELMAGTDSIRIEVACLMISAANDPVLHPGLTKGMEERVPNLTKVVIDDCGHWTQQEQPEATTEHMLAYLKGLDPWT